VALGILSGFLTLTKSVAGILFLVIPFSSLALHTSLRKVLGQFTIILTVTLAILFPWGLRNEIVLGRFTVLNSTGGEDLFIGNNPHATGEYYSWQNDIINLDPAFFSRDIMAQDEFASKAAFAWITENPLRAATLYFHKLVQMFSNERYVLDFAISYGPIEPPWPAKPPLPMNHPLRALDGLFTIFLNTTYAVVMILEVIGLAITLFWSSNLSFYTTKRVHIGIVIVALYFPLLSALFLSSTRFRWPFTDMLIPYAAIAILRIMPQQKFLAPKSIEHT
jgi:hypothetical protein